MSLRPMYWFEEIVRAAEKRDFSIVNALCISLLVGGIRLLEEWILGFRGMEDLPARLLQFSTFYWVCFLSYTVLLAPIVTQPWRKTANVVLLGLFCGLLPPVIDYLAGGSGTISYEYALVWDWTPWIYNPAARFTIGESSSLWLSVFLCGAYVGMKTRRVSRALLGLAAGYGAVFFNLSILFTVAIQVTTWASTRQQLAFDMTNWQLGTGLVLYLILRRDLAVGLARRFNHALPFGLVCLVGSAFAGQLNISIGAYCLLPLLGFCVAIAQNDLFDRDDDAVQGRPTYLDGADVAFMNATFLVLAVNFVLFHSIVGVALLIFFAVSVLYNYPSYRAKAHFPANVSIEGVWGASSAMVGVAATMEHNIPVSNFVLEDSGEPMLRLFFGPPGLLFLLFTFAGFTLVSNLKDYKDVRADYRAKIITAYTLAVRSALGLRRFHILLKTCVTLVMPIPFVVLHLVGRVPLVYGIGAIIAGVGIFKAMTGAPRFRQFEITLVILNIYLAYLTALFVYFPR